ncbi:MAG: energy transducer TonB [Candidatus Riflebacteria bacterium]|nr:energy transducer TonB [Candidatus Riflebacteria bacterium]
MNSEAINIKTQHSFFYLVLSFLIQFCIGASIWTLCNSINTERLEKKLNVSLIIPEDEHKEQIIKQEIIHLPEIEENEINPVEMSIDEIIPVDPFEQPRIMEMPEIPKEKSLPKKEKKQIRKEAPKIIEPKKEEKPLVEQPKTEIVKPVESISVQTPLPVKEKKQAPTVVTKPILTKAQVNENSKYLAKVMKIFEKNKVYPSDARVRHVEGKIVVSFCIDKNGKTSSIKAKTVNPKILADAAVDLVKKSKLPPPPAHWDVSAHIELPITYKLR